MKIHSVNIFPPIIHLPFLLERKNNQIAFKKVLQAYVVKGYYTKYMKIANSYFINQSKNTGKREGTNYHLKVVLRFEAQLQKRWALLTQNYRMAEFGRDHWKSFCPPAVSSNFNQLFCNFVIVSLYRHAITRALLMISPTVEQRQGAFGTS